MGDNSFSIKHDQGIKLLGKSAGTSIQPPWPGIPVPLEGEGLIFMMAGRPKPGHDMHAPGSL